MFEHHREPLLSRREFLRRMGRFAAAACLLVGVSWLIGIAGYMAFENMSLIDAILNSAMLLGGMGPVNELHTNGGKLFASFYALFSGLIFLVAAGVIGAPFLHRLLHQFHIADDDDHGEKQQGNHQTEPTSSEEIAQFTLTRG